ncbi:MAG TPA: hypothetical protein VM573_02195 [Actinomycetota bacterium]|nr:hypothetical protein [Actinomycetota bacterium]
MEKNTMDRQFADQAARWVIAALIACVALIGIVLLVGALVVALDPPMWAAVVLGTGLALGAAAFAWLVASALASRDDRESDRVRRLPRD